MKIYYSPTYDGDIFLGDAPVAFGKIYVGSMGLLEQLELRAGMHREPKAEIERNADYHNAMMRHIKGTILMLKERNAVYLLTTRHSQV